MTEKCIYCGKEGTNPVSNPDNLLLGPEDLEIYGKVDGKRYIENNGSEGTAVCGECEREHVEYI